MAIPPQRYIQWAQRSLNLSGVSAEIVTDGVDRPEYRQAVREFRILQDLGESEQVDAATQLALVQLNNVHPAYARWVHEALYKAGLLPLPAKDYLDPAAINAIRKFQSRPSNAGLVVDGVVGPNTEAKLIDVSGLKPPGENYKTMDPSKPKGPTAQEKWLRMVEASGVLGDFSLNMAAKNWVRLAPPVKGREARRFGGAIVWKSWNPRYDCRTLSSQMIQIFRLYPDDWSTCLIKAGGDQSLAEIIRYCNRLWNAAMEYYIVEKNWCPARARVVFRTEEKHVLQLMGLGFVSLYGSSFRPSLIDIKDIYKDILKMTDAQIDHLLSD